MTKIYYTTDENSLVFPCMDFIPETDAVIDPETEEMITPAFHPSSDWHVGNIDGPAYESHGVPRYKEQNGSIVLRSNAEIQADIDALPVPDPTQEELMRADLDYVLMLLDEA